ncbi:hypothetical protein GCM10022388_12180 [Flavobacterium chungnamense]|uniref:Glycosyltransferase RgtA/B/C/D-like domain-containing protein n=2 Tax=Flavobacterium chungnamense TaxID=706182 RepID=A0ABP7UND3_9FLAO
MKSLFLKYKFEILIVLIGFLWIEFLNFILQLDIQNRISPDAESYFESAYDLYFLHKGHQYRPVFLALIHGIPFLFGCSNLEVFKACYPINFLFWIGTGLLLFKILCNILTLKKSFYISLISIFFIGSAICIFNLYSENIYLFFIVLGFYFLQKYYVNSKFLFLSISLSIFIISMLIKPGAKLFAIFLVLFFVKEILKNYNNKAIIFLYGSFFLVLIQCGLLKKQYGDFTISYIDSVTYYNYLGSKAVCLSQGKKLNQLDNPRMDYIFSISNTETKKIAFDDLINQISNNKFYLFYAYLSDVYDNSTAGNTALDYTININNTGYFKFSKIFFFTISKFQNMFFTIIGFFLSISMFFSSYKKEPYFSLISFFVLYTIFLSGISCSQGDRFHLPILSFVLILIAKKIFDKTKHSFEPLQK